MFFIILIIIDMIFIKIILIINKVECNIILRKFFNFYILMMLVNICIEIYEVFYLVFKFLVYYIIIWYDNSDIMIFFIK